MGFKDLFIKKDWDVTTPVQEAKTAPVAKPAVPQRMVAHTNGFVDTTEADQDIKQALAEANIPGPDFHEFYESVTSPESASVPIKTKYTMTFTTLKVQGLTKDKLLKTCEQYKTLLRERQKQYEEGIAQLQEQEVTQRMTKVNGFAKDNENIAKQIAELTNKMNANTENAAKLSEEAESKRNQLSDKVTAYDTAIQNKIADFDATVQQINIHIL